MDEAVTPGKMLPGKQQEIITGVAVGQKVVANALELDPLTSVR